MSSGVCGRLVGLSGLLLSLVNASNARAQTQAQTQAQPLRGVVQLPDSATPAVAVIVQTSDARGVVLQRVLSDGRGRFTLTTATDRVSEVRVLRIGYAPTIVRGSPGELTWSAVSRIVLSGTRVQLARVQVRGDDVCRMSSDDGREVARVWEEARKALLASQLAENEPLDAEWVEYRREMPTTGDLVRTQQMRAVQNPTVHAFRSVSSSQLATQGYVERVDNGTIFHAPDLEVLLSDSFASRHCFHLEPSDATRSGLIGVGFRPVDQRVAVSDIAGTFWIDAASSELRTLEYRYTNLPKAALSTAAGGVVEFERIPSGSWIVARWHIRMPQYSARAQVAKALSVTPEVRGITLTGGVDDVSGVEVTGAKMLRVARGDSVLYRSGVGGTQLRLTSPDSTIALLEATVAIVGTEQIATADESGHVALGPMIAGRYRLAVSTPLMTSIGAAPVTREVTFADSGSRVVNVPMPSAKELLRAVCSSDVVARGEGYLRGVVRDSTGALRAGIPITLTWLHSAAFVQGGIAWNEQSISTRSNADGSWHACGVQRDQLITARVLTSELRARDTVRLGYEQAFGILNLQLRPLRTIGVGDGTLAAADGGALIDIHVADIGGHPLADAIVEVRGTHGLGRTVRTDSAGRALIPGVVPGKISVNAKLLGFAFGALNVNVEPGNNSIPIVLDRVRPPLLDTIRVVGNAVVLARHEEFERRKKLGQGTAFISREEIDARNPVSTWQLLMRVPSVMIADSVGTKVARTTRRMSVPCTIRVGVDGILLPEAEPDLKNLPAPSLVHGIEVFAGSSSTPLQYGKRYGDAQFCGLIMVWTR